MIYLWSFQRSLSAKLLSTDDEAFDALKEIERWNDFIQSNSLVQTDGDEADRDQLQEQIKIIIDQKNTSCQDHLLSDEKINGDQGENLEQVVKAAVQKNDQYPAIINDHLPIPKLDVDLDKQSLKSDRDRDLATSTPMLNGDNCEIQELCRRSVSSILGTPVWRSTSEAKIFHNDQVIEMDQWSLETQVESWGFIKKPLWNWIFVRK